MKAFQKNENGYFVCEECNVTYEAMNNFSKHIGKEHNKKEYYDKWIKEENEGKCKICKKETKFSSKFNIGYANCCSSTCVKLYSRQIFEKSMIEIYGTIIPMRVKKSRDKYEETMMQRYNIIVPIRYKKFVQDKYGVDNISQIIEVKNKKKITCLKNYGIEAGFLDKEKSKQTCLIKYGVEYPNQNQEQFNKGFKTRLLIHQYKNTILTYQGTYELDFIEKHYDKYPDIQNGLSFKYIMNGKNKVYHSDFYIQSLNLIVEIKNSYLAKRDKEEIKLKKQSVIDAGYNYLMILNKNYDEFIKITSVV